MPHRGGGDRVLRGSGPTPNSTNEGDRRGYSGPFQLSFHLDSLEVVVRHTLSSQVAVVLSLNRVGLVAMGMWSEEVWLRGTFNPKRMLLRARSSSVASYVPICVNILRGTPCRPSRRAVGEECREVKRMWV